MPITDLTNTTWRFNRTLTRSDISYNVSGTVYNATYSPYGFDYFGYNSDYGVDVFSFFYYSIPSPYEFGDGIGYIPENPLGYDGGWYMPVNESARISVFGITWDGSSDIAFRTTDGSTKNLGAWVILDTVTQIL